jgi:hypothetical protein
MNQKIRLDPHCDYWVENQWNTFVQRLQENHPFSFIKLNHGFWECFVKNRNSKATAFESMSRYKSVATSEAVLEILRNWTETPDLFVGLGVRPFRDIAVPDPNGIVNVIREILPTTLTPCYGPIWKEAFIDGKFPEFVEILNRYHVRIVGMEHLRSLGKEWGLKDSSFVPVLDPQTADLEAVEAGKYKLLHDLQTEDVKNTVYLFQLGEVFSFWLIHQLHPRAGNFYLDLGRSLDYRERFNVWNFPSHKYLSSKKPEIPM